MSSIKSEILKIDSVEKHPNADRLDIVQIKDKGWQCIVAKDSFKSGDLCLYIPIDSLLPSLLEGDIFGNSKIKLDNHRVRTIKLRGIISQGLTIKPETAGIYVYKEGEDVTTKLGITKYEPPAKLPSIYGICNKIKKRYINTNFHKYIDIENIKNHPNLFKDDENVYISEKLNGTSFRCGWIKTEANTWWKKVKKFLGLLDPYEFIVGSRNVQLTYGNKNKIFYKENVYTIIAKQYDLKNKLKNDEILYGEIIGDGIQTGYSYGCKNREVKLFAYDLMINNTWLNYKNFISLCYDKDIPVVPFLYIGPYSKSVVGFYTSGASLLCSDNQPIREGCVVKPIIEQISYLNRKILKSINSEYLLKDNSDFH